MYPIVILAWKCSNVYLMWIGIHYLSANVYPYFCADLSVTGVITSPFLVMTPHCRALSWLQQTSTAAIQNMWIVLGTWMAGQLVPSPSLIASSSS